MDTQRDFEQPTNDFTIFVVEQRYAIHRGAEYFRKHSQSKGYLNSSTKVELFLKKNVLRWINKYAPPLYELTSEAFSSRTDLKSVANALFKLFSATEHQAASPEIIDPIIVEEGNITKIQISQLVAMYWKSIHRPKIIFILADNDFARARNLLAQCPHKTMIKFIRNSGKSSLDYVVNSGANDIDSFLELYGRQCFNACLHTPTSILLNPDWSKNSIVKEYAPNLLHTRTKLMYGEKLDALQMLGTHIKSLESLDVRSEYQRKIHLGLLGFAKLFNVFCNDQGGEDIKECIKISEYLNDDLFTAHLNRYSFFIPNISEEERLRKLKSARNSFRSNGLEDQSIYCENNRLLYSFYKDSISSHRFSDNLNHALSNVPGLVGMPIIFNNLGVSYLYSNKYQDALDSFETGLRYSPQPDHQIGLWVNSMIARHLLGEPTTEKECEAVLNFSKLHLDKPKQAFLVANNLTNIGKLLSMQSEYGFDFFTSPDFNYFLKNALTTSALSTGSLATQLALLNENGATFNIKMNNIQSLKKSAGIRQKFMHLYGLNPAIFNAWL